MFQFSKMYFAPKYVPRSLLHFFLRVPIIAGTKFRPNFVTSKTYFPTSLWCVLNEMRLTCFLHLFQFSVMYFEQKCVFRSLFHFSCSGNQPLPKQNSVQTFPDRLLLRGGCRGRVGRVEDRLRALPEEGVQPTRGTLQGRCKRHRSVRKRCLRSQVSHSCIQII